MVMSAANNGLRKITLIPDDFSPEDQLVLKSLEPFIEEAAELLRRYTKEEQFIIDVFAEMLMRKMLKVIMLLVTKKQIL